MKFSIVTATYNKRGQSLTRAIESVQKQTFQDFEHIIAYQDSRYIELNPPKTNHVVVPDCTHFGNKQRSVGLENAKGEFVLMLDDDNILFENALETIVKYTDNADVVYSPIFHRKDRELGTEDFKHGGVDLLQWTIKTDFAKKVPFPLRGYSADFSYFKKLTKRGPRIVKNDTMIGVHWLPAEISKFQEIPGWFNCRELYWHVLERLPYEPKCAEVGVFMGRSAISLARDLKKLDGKLWAIDQWLRKSETYKYPDSDFTFQQFWKWAKQFKVDHRITPIRSDSALAATQFSDGFFDFVFLDAGHTYEDLVRDIDAWMPKVKNGGILAGDDYHETWPGVMRAVDEKLNGRFSLIGRGWWMYK